MKPALVTILNSHNQLHFISSNNWIESSWRRKPQHFKTIAVKNTTILSQMHWEYYSVTLKAVRQDSDILWDSTDIYCAQHYPKTPQDGVEGVWGVLLKWTDTVPDLENTGPAGETESCRTTLPDTGGHCCDGKTEHCGSTSERAIESNWETKVYEL